MEDLVYTFIATLIFFLYPTWRIHKRAGLNPAASLALLVPYVGVLIVAINLSLSKWSIGTKEGAAQ